jgi:hypothetical protein
MEKISNLLVEVLASNYIKIIKSLITKIQWDEIDPDFNEIKVAAYKIIENIQNIGEYEGDNTIKYLKILKNEAKEVIYVLSIILENHSNSLN